jgi:translocation protein SEC63
MYQHKYDESGLPSSFLLLTLALPFALYQSYKLFSLSKKSSCTCSSCKVNPRPKSYYPHILSALSWAIVAYAANNIRTIKYVSSTQFFNPFTILEVDETSSLAQIKKKYKTLLRPLSRKAKIPKYKEAATEMIKDINKAFEILKDPESYRNWIKTDTKKESAIAIPAFILKFSLPSFIIYIICLSVAIPWVIYKKYRAYKNQSSLGFSFKSSESFLDQIDSFSENDQDILFMQLIVFISRLSEFNQRAWKNTLNTNEGIQLKAEGLNVSNIKEKCSVKKSIEAIYGTPVVSDDEAYLHILDYLYRTNKGHPQDRDFIRSTIIALIEGFLRIALLKNKSKLYEFLMVFEKMINQCVFCQDYYLLQYPNVTMSDIVEYRQNKLKGSSAKSTSGNSVSLKKGLGSDIEFLSALVPESRLKETLKILHSIPVIEIKNLRAYTSTEENESDVQKEGDIFKIERNATPTIQFTLEKKNFSEYVHNPYSALEIKNKWRIYHRINGILHDQIINIDDFEGSKDIKFTIPSGDKRDELRIFAVQNGYFNSDSESSIIIRYY